MSLLSLAYWTDGGRWSAFALKARFAEGN